MSNSPPPPLPPKNNHDGSNNDPTRNTNSKSNSVLYPPPPLQNPVEKDTFEQGKEKAGDGDSGRIIDPLTMNLMNMNMPSASSTSATLPPSNPPPPRMYQVTPKIGTATTGTTGSTTSNGGNMGNIDNTRNTNIRTRSRSTTISTNPPPPPPPPYHHYQGQNTGNNNNNYYNNYNNNGTTKTSTATTMTNITVNTTTNSSGSLRSLGSGGSGGTGAFPYSPTRPKKEKVALNSQPLNLSSASSSSLPVEPFMYDNKNDSSNNNNSHTVGINSNSNAYSNANANFNSRNPGSQPTNNQQYQQYTSGSTSNNNLSSYPSLQQQQHQSHRQNMSSHQMQQQMQPQKQEQMQQGQEQQQQQKPKPVSIKPPEILVRRLYKPKFTSQLESSQSVLNEQFTSLQKLMSQSNINPRKGKEKSKAKEIARQARIQEYEAKVTRLLPQSELLGRSSLALPDDFGRIHLGETFNAYICIVNPAPTNITLYDVTCILKPKDSKEIPLSNVAIFRSESEEDEKNERNKNNNNNSSNQMGRGTDSKIGTKNKNEGIELKAAESLDMVVKHVLQELDMHHLTIKFYYIDVRNGGERKPFSKRYKFKVYNSIKVENIALSVNQETIYIQSRVKNVTENNMKLNLDAVDFVVEDPSMFKVEKIDYHTIKNINNYNNDDNYNLSNNRNENKKKQRKQKEKGKGKGEGKEDEGNSEYDVEEDEDGENDGNCDNEDDDDEIYNCLKEYEKQILLWPNDDLFFLFKFTLNEEELFSDESFYPDDDDNNNNKNNLNRVSTYSTPTSTSTSTSRDRIQSNSSSTFNPSYISGPIPNQLEPSKSIDLLDYYVDKGENKGNKDNNRKDNEKTANKKEKAHQRRQFSLLKLVDANRTPLGNLRIRWRSTLGEHGSLLSQTIFYTPGALGTTSLSTATSTGSINTRERIAGQMIGQRKSLVGGLGEENSNLFGNVEIRYPSSAGPSKTVNNYYNNNNTYNIAQTTAFNTPIDIQLSKPLPLPLCIQQIYTMTILITNNTKQEMNLQLYFNQSQMQGVYITGLVHINVGIVKGSASKEVSVNILPLFGGLYDIGGLTLRDLNTRIEYDVRKLCQVRIASMTNVGASVGINASTTTTTNTNTNTLKENSYMNANANASHLSNSQTTLRN